MSMIGILRHGTCIDVRHRLNDFCDGELPPSTEQRVRRHVAGCRVCRRVLDKIEATLADLATLGRSSPPPTNSVRDSIVTQIKQDRDATEAGNQ
ncbi:MAG: zf-HC2 domain-containing protein [Ilumatobacteraceae bacterium]|nr:zf-HC2 domain-containing protein [Ilumatobacteraceae bacterium]